MSEVVYQKGESRIEADKYPTVNTKNLLGISLLITANAVYYIIPPLWEFGMSTATPVEQPTVVLVCVLVGLLLFLVFSIATLMLAPTNWVYKGYHIGIYSSATGTTAIIPLSPTSPNPCEEPEFKAAYTKAINEMKAEIDKIEAERAEKNARRDACVASLKEMAK